MLGYRMFVHSLRQVFGNFNDALRISLPFILLTTVQYVAWLHFGVIQPDSQMADDDPRIVHLLLVNLALIVLSTVVWSWTAVAWHRFVLRSEMPGVTGAFHGRLILRYFWTGLLISLLVTVWFVAAGVLIGSVGSAVLKGDQTSLSFAEKAALVAAAIGACIALMPLGLRYISILPAVALGNRVSINEGWQGTRGHYRSLLVLAVPTLVVSVGCSYLPAVFMYLPLPGIINTINVLVVSVISSWLSFLLNLSVLTTMYGYFFERRPLV